jgi:protein SCO1/2
MRRAAIALCLLLLALPADAVAERPQFAPVIGNQIDRALRFSDEHGAELPLGALLGGKPALVMLGYHRCTNLCGLAQRDLAEALKAAGLPSSSYDVLFASIDPEETSDDAADSREKLAEAASDADLSNWHFLVGKAPAIEAIEHTFGVTAVKPFERGLYIHPVAVSAVTADGRVSRVLSGLDYPARDLRLALVEASQGHLGTLGEQILLFCSGFDAATGRYNDVVMLSLRVLGIAVFSGLGACVLIMARRRRTA